MKKNIIALVLAALMISGINVCASENVTNITEAGEALEDEEQSGENIEIENIYPDIEKVVDGEAEIKEEEMKEEEEGETIENASDSEEVEENTDKKGIVCLQVPQKLDLMIDPFEINEKGQIYSENYFIKNAGTETGILTLSDINCKPGDKSEVNIITENEGMHETDAKAVYVKIIFENDEEVVLSEEGAEYKVRLAPGEELQFHYSGEVNENASRNWSERDITVGMTYFWNAEDELGEKIAEEKKEENLQDKPNLSEIMNTKMDKLKTKDEPEDSDKNILEEESGGDEE